MSVYTRSLTPTPLDYDDYILEDCDLIIFRYEDLCRFITNHTTYRSFIFYPIDGISLEKLAEKLDERYFYFELTGQQMDFYTCIGELQPRMYKLEDPREVIYTRNLDDLDESGVNMFWQGEILPYDISKVHKHRGRSEEGCIN